MEEASQTELRFRLARPLYELASLSIEERYCCIDTVHSYAYKGHPEILTVWADSDLCATVDFGIREVYLEDHNRRITFDEISKFTRENLGQSVSDPDV